MTDYDVLVVGSGFGGSVTALRLTEKGYRVGVLEAGARFADDDFPATSFDTKTFLFRPEVGLLRHPADRRAPRLPDPRPAPGSAAARWSTPTRSTSRCAPFYDDPQWARHHRLAGRAGAVLRPGQADARRRRQPACARPSDEVMEQVADEMGVGDTFHPTPVGVFFGGPGAAAGEPVADPFFGGAGPDRNHLHRLRRVHDRAAGTTPRTPWSRTTSTSPSRPARRCCR